MKCLAAGTRWHRSFGLCRAIAARTSAAAGQRRAVGPLRYAMGVAHEIRNAAQDRAPSSGYLGTLVAVQALAARAGEIVSDRDAPKGPLWNVMCGCGYSLYRDWDEDAARKLVAKKPFHHFASEKPGDHGPMTLWRADWVLVPTSGRENLSE